MSHHKMHSVDDLAWLAQISCSVDTCHTYKHNEMSGGYGNKDKSIMRGAGCVSLL